MKNDAEQKFKEFAKQKGWNVTRRGYPDFWCYDKETNTLIFVEVKRKVHHNLRASQQNFFTRISSTKAIKCFRWTPPNGLKEFESGER